MLGFVRKVTLGLIVAWLALVVGMGWWLSQRSVSAWLGGLADGAEFEARTTARVVDQLFSEMVSVANMVAHQVDVNKLATRYRTDPPGFAELTRQERAAQFAHDPLARKVGDFMNALSRDLRYSRIYMNNMSDDTVTTSNWAEPDSIAGMIYSGRTYLMDALRKGNGHSFGIARLLKIPSYFVSSRIEDADDVPLGSVTVRFDAPEMANYLKGQHVALIVNRQGRVTTASSERFMLRNVAALLPPGTLEPSRDEESPGEPMSIRAIADRDRTDQWLVDGQPYLVQRQPLSDAQYQLLTLASLEQLAPMRRQHILNTLLVAGFGAILILLSGHLAGEMLRRRQDEQQAAMRTSALNADLSAALAAARTNERQKVEVLGYIGHDLRAPLATISGYAGLLLADAHEKQRKLLLTIQNNVKYQLDLIEELLEYAKSELQPLALRPVTTELLVLLDEISDYGIALCLQRNNHFRFEPSGRMPRRVFLDGKRLQQVLLNLISNAAKFTRDGLVTLSVTAKSQEGSCLLHFAVSDTGVGIDFSQNIDIFGPFTQIRSSGGSIGLGLFIARRIVSAMGGELGVTSTPAKGTTFSFELSVPVDVASDAAWSFVPHKETSADEWSHQPALPRDAMPADEALVELAELALHGRLTDIERWTELHANEAVHAPFVAQLRGLLERLDFRGVHALALRGME